MYIEPTIPLLPCPFCGGAGMIFHDTSSDYKRHWRFIPECKRCEMEGRHCSTEEEAVRWWNTRILVPPKTGVADED